MAGVSFRQLSKVYADGTVGVSALDMEVADGEFMVLVGPSGCGKTTALRCVAGLEDITSGQLRIDDRIVNHVPSKDRNIAMVFQSYALYPHMTVRENMAFGLNLMKTPKAEITRRVDEAARVLDLERFLDRKPKALSGGQRQRVALGRAIVREPAASLMDEPLSNLDAALRVQTRAEILKLQKRLGTTTIYVTHDQIEAMTMGDRIAVMRGGHLQQVGAPELLYNYPVNMFVAGFIGSPAMNFASVDVDGEGLLLGSTRLRLTGRAPAPAADGRRRQGGGRAARRLEARARLPARGPLARAGGRRPAEHAGHRRGDRVPRAGGARPCAGRRRRGDRPARLGAQALTRRANRPLDSQRSRPPVRSGHGGDPRGVVVFPT